MKMKLLTDGVYHARSRDGELVHHRWRRGRDSGGHSGTRQRRCNRPEPERDGPYSRRCPSHSAHSSHMDHAGSAAAIKAASTARVYASEADTPAIQGVVKPPNPPTHWYWRPMYWPAVFFPDPPPVEVDHFVSEDANEVLPGDLRAIDTPGHTPGHTSYILDRDDGLLLVGDAAVATKDGRVKRLAFNRSTPDIDGSLRHLAEFEFEIAAFCHSKPIRTHASGAFRRFAESLTSPNARSAR